MESSETRVVVGKRLTCIRKSGGGFLDSMVAALKN